MEEARTMYQRLVQSNSENARYKESLREIEAKLAESEEGFKTSKCGVPTTEPVS